MFQNSIEFKNIYMFICLSFLINDIVSKTIQTITVRELNFHLAAEKKTTKFTMYMESGLVRHFYGAFMSSL